MKTLALALALTAQDPRLNRLEPEARAVVTHVVDSARSVGLPAEPLVDRALEGASKGAPAPLITAAVRRLAADLGRAREVLGSRAGPGEITAAADALRAGAPPDVILRIRDALGARRMAVPLGVTADLAARGVPPDTAATLVITIARSVADADLLALQRDMERDIALGASPLAAATGRLAAEAYTTADALRNTGAVGGGSNPPVRRKP